MDLSDFMQNMVTTNKLVVSWHRMKYFYTRLEDNTTVELRGELIGVVSLCVNVTIVIIKSSCVVQDRSLHRISGLILSGRHKECLYTFCIAMLIVSLTDTLVKLIMVN